MTEKFPILKNISMRPSEMQQSSTAYAVGYFVGSSERGDYTSLNKTLKNITKVTKTEVSYQTVGQNNVSSKMWQKAYDKAMAYESNPNAKAHRSMKYKFSTPALMIYVDKKEHVKKAKRNLFDKFGTLEDENV